MTIRQVLPVRVDARTWARVGALLSALPGIHPVEPVTVSTVARMALSAGLSAIERRVRLARRD